MENCDLIWFVRMTQKRMSLFHASKNLKAEKIDIGITLLIHLRIGDDE